MSTPAEDSRRDFGEPGELFQVSMAQEFTDQAATIEMMAIPIETIASIRATRGSLFAVTRAPIASAKTIGKLTKEYTFRNGIQQPISPIPAIETAAIASPRPVDLGGGIIGPGSG